MCRSITYRNVSFQGRFGRMRSSPSRIGKTALLKSAIGVTKRAPAAASLRPDVRGSVAVYEQSFPPLPNSRPYPVPSPRIRSMNIHNGLLIAACVGCSISGTPAFAKTAKECTEEWRADKAGMQARGVTEKAYVGQCKGGAEPTAAAPAAKPAETASPAAPRQTGATGSKTAKDWTAESIPHKPAMPAPAGTPKARCPTDPVVWVNLPSKGYHFAGTKSYGTTKRGAYMCEKEAIAAENRASKTEKHP